MDDDSSKPTAVSIEDILRLRQLAKKYERKPDENGSIWLWLTPEQYAAFTKLEAAFGLGPGQTPIPDEDVFDKLEEWANEHE